MKKLLKNKKNIYRILIVAFVVTSLLIICLNGKKEYEDLKNEQGKKALETAKMIDVKMEFLTTALDDFKTTAVFKNYLESHGNSFYDISLLYKELTKRNNIYGKLGYNLSITKSDSNLVITPWGTRNKLEYYKELGFSENADSSHFVSISEKDGDVNLLIKNRELFYGKNIYWIVSFDKNLFFSELNLKNDNNWYLYNGDLFPLRRQTFSEKKIAKIEEDIKHDRKLENILIFPQQNYKFDLVYIKPKVDILEIIIIESIKILFLISILGAITYYLIKLLNKPIKELAIKMDSMLGINSEEQENISDIDYIEQKIEELNDIKINLEEKVDYLDTNAKKKILKDYMLGIVGVNDIDREELNKLNLEDIRIALLEIFDMDTLDENYENFIPAKEYIISKLKDIGAYKSVEIDYKSLVLIIKNDDNEIIENNIKSLIEEVENKYFIKFVCGVSDRIEKIDEIPKMYRESKKILEYKFIFKSYNVLFYDNINKKQINNNYYYPIEIESKIISKVLNGNALGVKKLVDEAFDDKIDSDKMSKEKVREFSALLYNTLHRVVLQLEGFHTEKKIEDLNIEKIARITDIDTLKESFLATLLDICKLTKNEDQNDTDIIKLKMKTYLEENYMKDLSLENLADYLGHSFKYTSILFKKVMGDNFKNYLNLYRMSKAKELMLSNRDLKIKDIAQMVGCNSSNTFIRIFRKYEGVSPTQYLYGVDESENE